MTRSYRTREPIRDIAYRGGLHVLASAGAVLGVSVALGALARTTTWLPTERRPILLVAALAVFATSALREARDVARGQSLTKAIWDHASWAIGCALSAWALAQL